MLSDKEEEWKKFDFQRLLMLYRDLCCRYSVELYKNSAEIIIQEINYEMDMVRELLVIKFYDKTN